MGNTEGTGQDALNAREVKTMDWELKHKLARGSTYNSCAFLLVKLLTFPNSESSTTW